MLQIDYLAIAPELTLVATAVLVLLVDLVLRGDYKQLANPIATVGAVVALAFTITQWGDLRSFRVGLGAQDIFYNTDFALVFKTVFLVALIAVLGISWRYFAEGRYFQGEYYFLLLVSFLGMLVMPSARDLLTLFVALETVSIPGFVLAGLRKRDLYSSEAAIKFFLIGVLSVALMLFGMSIIYGFTGTTMLSEIAAHPAMADPAPAMLAAILLVIVGFGFKVSAVPFHFWAPDTYAGAPMPVAAMLAVASKAAGFAGLIAVTYYAFLPAADSWAPILGVLGAITMTLGNLIALQQRDIVRLLAYSSVAQAGYMLVPFGVLHASGATAAVDNARSLEAVVLYLAAYTLMNLGAFGVAIAVNRKTGDRAIADFSGLGSRSPLLAMGLTVFLLALAGIPPTVGFWAKFEVFFAAAGVGTAFGYSLAVFVAINSVIAMFYYLRVAASMWMGEAREGQARIQPGLNLQVVVAGLAILTLLFGFLPGLITDHVQGTSVAADA
ncbi:MAG: NADH-quinone oxidoreductase subunit N [Nitriliruptoraceae bacterium]